MLPDTERAVALITVGYGAGTRAAYRVIFPLIRTVMRQSMRIDSAGAELGWQQIGRALDRIEAELQPSGYLAGDAFSVADLTAAALLSPLLAPREFPYPPCVPMPEAIAERRRALTDRPAVRWAEAMYARHRGTSAALAG